MPDPEIFAASIVAESFVDKVKGNALGALGEYLPSCDVSKLAEEIGRRLGKPFRLALLGTNTKDVTSKGRVEVTYSVSEANRWRNDADAKKGKRVFVFVTGMVSKLPSLRDVLLPVSEKDLREIVFKRAASWLELPEHRAFWGFLYRNPDIFTLRYLVEFAASCEEVATRSNKHDLPDFEQKNAWMIGMIPHVKLLATQGEKNVEKVAKPNLEMVRRLRVLSKKDRMTITNVIEDERTLEALRSAAKSMLEFARTKKRQALQALDFEQVVAVLSLKKAPKKKPDGSGDPGPAPKERMLGDEAAIEDILYNNGENLKALVRNFAPDVEEGDQGKEEVVVSGRTVVKKNRIGTSAVSRAVNRLITDKRFGGIVHAEAATDYLDCLKQLEAGESTKLTPFLPLDTDDKYAIQNILDRTVGIYSGSLETDVLAAWAKYREAREALLEYKHELADHPLLAMLNDRSLLEASDSLVKAYGVMMNAVAYLRTIIRNKHPEASKRLMSRALALDVIFLRSGENAVAIAGPTHPFHLWRWVQIANLLVENKEDFRDLGEDLVLKHAANPPVSSPHLLLNSFVEDIPGDHVFIGIGSIGSLPLYGDPESRTAAKFRAEEIGDLAQRFVGMAQYAKYGLEVVVIDPPSISDIIESLINVNRGRSRDDLIPVHVRVFRTREAPSSTDEEDAEIEELASIVRETKGSIQIEPKKVTLEHVYDKLKDRAAHYTLVFEPGDSTSFKVGIDISPTLSPLIVPRHYTYDQIEDQFDVIIHGDATPFGAYYNIFCDLMNIPTGNTIGRRSGASRWIPAIGRIGESTMWFSIIDQGIEPTFKIPGAIRLDKRSLGGGSREIHTFTSHADSIMRHIERVIAAGGLVPDAATSARMLRLMQRLGGDTVPLAVSSAPRNGQVVDPQARGLLGVLAVTSWYEQEAPESLLISLDTEASRRWILGANEEDGRRGDMLAIRQTHEGLRLEVLEVKAREDEKAVYRINGGEKNGKTIQGYAIGQIDNTISILKRILPTTATSGVDRARREILRDQLYMSVANRMLTPVQRERAVQMLDEFFSKGTDKITGRLFIVHVESHRTPEYPSTPKGFGNSPGGNTIEVIEIIESEIERVDPAKTLGDAIPPPKPAPTGRGKVRPAKETVDKKKPLVPQVEHEKISAGTGKVTHVIGVKPPAPTGAVVPPENFSVLIGKDPTGKDVTWDTAENPNFGLLVTGDPGTGKTQLIRAIMHELRKAGYPILVFDFKNDYSDEAFNKQLKLKVYDVAQHGLPFNPLGLMPNENGIVQPIRQCHEFAAIVARVEGLKEQQTHRLVEAQRHAYENHNLDPSARISIDKVVSEPVFDEVLEILRHDDDSVSSSVVYRLQKFSDMGLFPSTPMGSSFEDLIRDGIVLTLNDASNDKLMQILAEIMIVKLHTIIKRGQQPRVLRRMLVFDEAWRIAKSQRVVDLAREGRAFGVGMLIGTQYPKDLPENLVGCLRTQIYLYNRDPENQKVIVRAICNATSGPQAQQLLRTVSSLGTFQGFLISQQYGQGTRVNVIPHKDRA